MRSPMSLREAMLQATRALLETPLPQARKLLNRRSSGHTSHTRDSYTERRNSMGRDEDDSEREINEMARQLGKYICRQRFGWGKVKKVCTKPKGHKGPHKQ